MVSGGLNIDPALGKGTLATLLIVIVSGLPTLGRTIGINGGFYYARVAIHY